MYHGWRFFSHSGTCWTIATIAASCGASRSAAGRRKTPVVWYDSVPSLFCPRRGVTTTKSCAMAVQTLRRTKVIQPCVGDERRPRNGDATAMAAEATIK